MNVALGGALEINEILHGLADDLYDLASSVQRPRLADGAWRDAVSRQCRDLAERARLARAALVSRSDVVSPALERLYVSLTEYAGTLADCDNARRLKEMAGAMSDQYEDLRRRIRKYRRSHRTELGAAAKPLELRPLKPTNYRRNLFHVGMGLFGVLMYELFLTPAWAIGITGVLAGTVVLMEVARRVHPRVNWALTLPFKQIIRPWERNRPNSASWYSLAVFLSVLVMPQFAAELGVLTLAFADPAATLVGKRWGRVKLIGEKSVLGTLAFLATALLAGGILFALAGPAMPAWRVAGMLGSAAVAATVTELACDRLDDNFAIPLLCGGVAALWMIL
jgi:dolichol kinase